MQEGEDEDDMEGEGKEEGGRRRSVLNGRFAFENFLRTKVKALDW